MCPSTAEVPVLICTTNLRVVRDTEGWLAAKGIAIVPKPFTLHELLQAVMLQLRTRPQPPTATGEEELRADTAR
jgi:hypothetical protein